MPVLNLRAFAPGELVHDRYFYLPSFGACILVALAFHRLASGVLVFRLPVRWVFATLTLVVVLSYATANAVTYWANN